MALKEPVSVFTNFPAGGEPAGIYQGCVATFIETHTGFPFSKLSDGIHASSVGTSIGVPLYAKHQDDPSRPRFTAAETSDMCETYSQVWLEKRINFLLQHVKSLHPSYKNGRSHFRDDKVVEQTLDKFMGDVTFADLMGSVFISGHSLSAEPEKVSVIFSKIEGKNGVTYSHSSELKVAPIMQGSMAVPGNFMARNIEGVGDISDFAMVYSADRAFRNFRRNLEPGTQAHFLELGCPRFFGVASSDFNRHSLLGLLTKNHFMRAVSNQSYSNAIQGIREEIGDDCVHDMTPTIHLTNFSGRGRVTEDILDARKQTIALAKEFSQDYIERNIDKFRKVADFLGENRVLKNQPRLELPPAIIVKKPGLTARLTSFIPYLRTPAEPALSVH